MTMNSILNDFLYLNYIYFVYFSNIGLEQDNEAIIIKLIISILIIIIMIFSCVTDLLSNLFSTRVACYPPDSLF